MTLIILIKKTYSIFLSVLLSFAISLLQIHLKFNKRVRYFDKTNKFYGVNPRDVFIRLITRLRSNSRQNKIA